MRLVKKTVNQDDVSAYHLFYADGAGIARHRPHLLRLAGRAASAAARTASPAPACASPASGTLDWWRERLARAGVTHGEIAERDGRRRSTSRTRRASAHARRRRRRGPAHPWDRSPVPAEHQIRGLGPITLSVPDLAPTELVLTAVMNMRRSRDYPHAAAPTARRSMSTQMGQGGPAAELHVAVEPGPARRRRRAPAASTTSPSAPPTPSIRRWADRLRQMRRPQQRPGRPLLLPQPLLPRAERHPLRDRDRRPRLRGRRAGRDAWASGSRCRRSWKARRHADRGRAEAALRVRRIAGRRGGESSASGRHVDTAVSRADQGSG